MRTATDGLQNMISQIILSGRAVLYLNAPITTVTKLPNGKYHLHSSNHGDITVEYDYIIVASPLKINHLRWQGFSDDTALNMLGDATSEPYYAKCVTFVLSSGLNPEFVESSGLDITNVTGILTSAASDAGKVPFYSITVEFPNSNGTSVFKIFSRDCLNETELAKYLITPKYLTSNYWVADFPTLNPRDKFDPIELDERVYYISPVESFATAMEGTSSSQ